MLEDQIIDDIIAELSKYPNLRYERKNDHELKIFRNNANGFDIFLETWVREHTLHLGSFHWHFDNNAQETEEMMEQLLRALLGLIRIKEFSKKGEAYKWTLQIQDVDGNWIDDGTMSTMNFDFWNKSEIRYLQNKTVLPL